MEPVKVTLCPDCEHCPTVEIDEKEVRIGEDSNVVKLTHAEWNELVSRVLSGELRAA